MRDRDSSTSLDSHLNSAVDWLTVYSVPLQSGRQCLRAVSGSSALEASEKFLFRNGLQTLFSFKQGRYHGTQPVLVRDSLKNN